MRQNRKHAGRGAAMLVLAAGACAGALAQEPDFAAPGKKLFVEGVTGQANCALCHVLEHAGSHGPVGPNLNELGPDEERVRKAVRNGIGPMPAFTWLSDDQVTLLARYVSWASKPR